MCDVASHVARRISWHRTSTRQIPPVLRLLPARRMCQTAHKPSSPLPLNQ
jgi:hypothetical protein